MQQIIGTVTRYIGTELRYLRGYTVRIIAITRGTEAPDFDPDDEYDEITSDEELAALGGVTANDGVIVQPWLDRHGRYSFAYSDPAAIDLECFAHLREGAAPTTAAIEHPTSPNAPTTARHANLAIQGVFSMPNNADLNKLTIKELKTRITALSGQPPRSNNRPYLARKLAKLLEAEPPQAKATKPKAKPARKAKAAAAKPARKAKTAKTAKAPKAPKKATTAKARKAKAAAAPTATAPSRSNTVAAPATKAPRRSIRKKGERDPRLPAPGTVLTREYKGETIEVEVLEDGFRYAGEHCRSLSTVARKATGTIWNGFLFFGLTAAPKRTTTEQAAA